VQKRLVSKKKMSELVGWSESNGRRWVKNFKEYIPEESSGQRVVYTEESIRVMKLLKKLNEIGLYIPEIKQLFHDMGLPKNAHEEKSLIEKVKYRRLKFTNDNPASVKDSIPSIKDMMLPYLSLIKDGKPYPASEITKN
jgi:restriction system protein